MSHGKDKKAINNDSGGYISVNREKALKENWETIQQIKRPANPTGDTPKPPSDSQKKVATNRSN